MPRTVVMAVMGVVLAGCAVTEPPPEEKYVAQDSKNSGSATSEDRRTGPPEGAIEIGEDMYMVPVGVSAAGCRQYTAWSSTKAVLTVIQYRRSDGGFTMIEEEADCGS